MPSLVSRASAHVSLSSSRSEISTGHLSTIAMITHLLPASCRCRCVAAGGATYILRSPGSARERAPRYSDSDQVIVAERPQGTFTRQFALGEGVDSEHLTADYAGGVLHVTIPAAAKAQARRIDVAHAPAGSRAVSGSTEK